ncbi:MAG TPA: hypothetical protein DCE42_00150 [Myxococcales bacterium]|nr:hypothetical protein [Deltaproteobacteria bacterium]HAA53131.1 hypothetical protein [Myxococcales bacterium]|tara:strand:+ start:5773 stop:6567 length:795 start_codon:yes stop_codon:yes gene_type:complete
MSWLQRIKTLRRKTIEWQHALIPERIREKFDAEEYSITQFIKLASSQVESTDRVLDAGAGTCAYKSFFEHAQYESTDIKDYYGNDPNWQHTFLSDLTEIPRPNNFYDVIVNTQVLEHVRDPQAVIHEFYRILKPGGTLYLTAPQGWGIHEAPHNYFNFTSYGLKLLFENAGFSIEEITPRGGIFWYLGKQLRVLPDYILTQFFKEQHDGVESFAPSPWLPLMMVWYASTAPPLKFILPLILHPIDQIDRQQTFTLGYACICKKP